MDASALADQVRAGNVRAVGRLMSLVENRDPLAGETLQRLQATGHRALIVGITGYPGTGKSTLIAQLALDYRRRGRTVGIVAVDATSPLTGGALLGDRIRMQELACDPGVFIRSVASRGHHGGVAECTRELALVLEAAGFEVVLIETVGVGQEEVSISAIAPTVVAVVAPGLGDEVQAMKAGIFELAHIVVVNKGDHEAADSTVRHLQDWFGLVVRTVAVKGEGIPELVEAIAARQDGVGNATADATGG